MSFNMTYFIAYSEFYMKILNEIGMLSIFMTIEILKIIFEPKCTHRIKVMHDVHKLNSFKVIVLSFSI